MVRRGFQGLGFWRLIRRTALRPLSRSTLSSSTANRFDSHSARCSAAGKVTVGRPCTRISVVLVPTWGLVVGFRQEFFRKTNDLTLLQFRVATNLKNLEFCGISLNVENSGNSVRPQGKIVNKQSSFHLSFKYLCETAIDWVIRILHGHSVVVNCYSAGVDVEWPLMKVVITFTFCCDNLWKSEFVALGKAWKTREFFSRTSWPPCSCVISEWSLLFLG